MKRNLVRRLPFLAKWARALDAYEAANGELAAQNRRLKETVHRLTRPGLAGGAARPAAGPDGLPLPPPPMISWAAGRGDDEWFLEGGTLGAQTIVEVLTRHGLALGRFGDVLDFGCGCGRVLRHLRGWESVRLHGTDCNREAIRWCDENLPFAEFGSNGLEPPLRYRSGSFDLVYAFSVFTHLTEPLQKAWMAEMARVLRPGGYLLLTVHGDRCSADLSEAERAEYRRGRLVLRWHEAEGYNDCGAYHPESYVRTVLARGFEVVDFLPAGARGNPPQDAYLLRSRSAGVAA